MATQQGTVVVGVDGSEASRAAIALGAREARLHGHRLRLVHAFVWPLLGVHLGPSPEGPADGGLAADADRVLAGALAHAAAVDPDLPVAGEVVTGNVVPVLLAEAERAALVVVGDRGLGGFAGLLVGSVAIQVVAHARGPVLVARGAADATDAGGPVVVGVDGSANSAEAVEFGFAEAAARGAELVALRSWSGRLPQEQEQELPLIYDVDDVLAEQARRLAGWVAPARARFPGVIVHEQARHGRPARALVEASATAQLVVVGARGRGGFAGLLLGSVSQAVLHHAGCPVAIVPAATGGEQA
ncbi:MAG: universal stress protein [Micromonosporaceae bacterium]|nr:universal stress protein [Micromonosporaceae bacterium]